MTKCHNLCCVINPKNSKELQRNKSYLAHEGQTDKSNESWLIANQKFPANPLVVTIIIIIIIVMEGVKNKAALQSHLESQV